MAVVATITEQWTDGKRVHVIGALTFSSTYATGGDAFDFQSGPTVSVGTAVKTSKQPSIVLIEGKAGFVFQYDYAAKKILAYSNTAGGANAALGEHTAAAYAAGITGDSVKFYAIYPRG